MCATQAALTIWGEAEQGKRKGALATLYKARTQIADGVEDGELLTQPLSGVRAGATQEIGEATPSRLANVVLVRTCTCACDCVCRIALANTCASLNRKSMYPSVGARETVVWSERGVYKAVDWPT